MRKLETILPLLGLAHANLLRAADAIGPGHWATAPSEAAWSAAEVIAHLIQVERTIVGAADRVSQKPAKPIPLHRRWRLPLALVEFRVLKRKTPIPVDPALLGEKEEMLAKFREVRERTLAFLDEVKSRDLSSYRWPHPFLGSLNLYEWFEMLARHEIRHTKQLRGIAVDLPKAIAVLEK
jgi:hypothetical protein